MASGVTPERLGAFFHPHSVAMIGATDKSPWSLSLYNNLNNLGFPGPIFCVNPNHTLVHGEPAVKRLSDIDQPVDLAYIMVPTRQVYPIMQEAAEHGISNLVILTSGFAEMGSAGFQLEQKILEYAQSHNMTLLGPNCIGYINATAHIAPYSLPILPPLIPGPVSIVLQSGALASVVLSMSQARYIGVNLLVSVGNEAMISTTDVIDYLIEDETTRVIALFLESIRRPEEFRRLARKALQHNKPIVALKVGKSDIAARTAQAHTGSLVGNDAVNDAAFKQFGIIRVSSLEDLLCTAGLLAYSSPLPGRRMAVVTASGGVSSMLADRSQEEGITLPAFAPETVERLKNIVPEFTTVQNPMDTTGYLLIDRMLLRTVLHIVTWDPGLDFVVCIFDPPRVPLADVEQQLQQFDAFAQIARDSSVPVIFMSYANNTITPFGGSVIERTGLHFLGGMQHGMTALGKALWWYETRHGVSSHSEASETTTKPILAEPPVGKWSEYKARNLLQASHIPFVPAMLATHAQEAVAAARQLGLPVALKIQSAEIVHKTDVGGVLLNVATEDAVYNDFQTLISRVKTQFPDADIEGVLVTPMRPAGAELLVGIIRDPVWGLVLAVGLGGIWVEVFKDTVLRILPVQRPDIKNMLNEMRGAALLQGTRGQPPVNMDALTDVIFRVTQVAQSLEDYLESLEINPLLIHGSTIEALDVLLTWIN